MSAPLRVGLVIDNTSLPAWQVFLLEKLRQQEGIELALVIHLPQAGPGGGSLYQTFAMWAPPGDAMARRKAAQSLAGIPHLNIYRGRIDGTNLEVIQRAGLDVLVQLSGERINGQALLMCRWGLWYFMPSGEGLEVSTPGFRAVLKGQNTCELRLAARESDDLPARLLYSSTSATNLLSIGATRGRMYWKGAAFVLRLLRQAADGRNPLADTPLLDEKQKAERLPSDGEMLRLGAVLAGRRLANLAERARSRTQWKLYYRFEDQPQFTLAGARPLVPPKDRFWSDPFPSVRNGRHYVFFEELLYKTNRGRISVLELDPAGLISSPRPVLELPYHLSYPFLFEWQGQLYMIPEAAASKKVTAYRCVEFPYRWEPAAVLLEGVQAWDTTLVEHAGRWWMFTTQREHPRASSWDELFLYLSDSPLSSSWQPYPLNPVVSDVSRARMAGGILQQNGRLFRPGQNSVGGYGAGLVIHEILHLAPEIYEEQPVIEIHAQAGPSGVHTFNHAGGLTMLDGKGKVSRW